MFLFYLFLILSVLGAVIHYFFFNTRRTYSRMIELLLLYQFVFNIGVLGFLSFIGLTFMPDLVAQHNRWPMSPFQQEMGNVNLAFSVLGILCIWIRGHFWTATAIGAAVWLFADGIHHLYDVLYRRNYSEGNLGVLLYSDFLIPVVLIVLLCLHLKNQNRGI